MFPEGTKGLPELGERMQVPLRLLRTAERINDSLLPPSTEPPVLRLLPVQTHEVAEPEALGSQAA